jgi:hypothetical protein
VNGWLMAEGFIEGKSGKQPGKHLTGEQFLPMASLTGNGIDESQLRIVRELNFIRGRTP